jgi:hypothetical protein
MRLAVLAAVQVRRIRRAESMANRIATCRTRASGGS